MYPNYKYIVIKTTFNLETQSVPRLNEAKAHNINSSDLLISLFPIGFVICGTGLFLMISKLRTVAIERMVVTKNSLHQVRCQNCQFFSNNRYLKCAVQPSIVLTKEAKNCTDYSPNNKKSIK